MDWRFVSVLLLLAVSYAHAFVVPQELPSVLSLVYSNIPPVKKGTDSRLGFGYRLGEHADFQVLVELGPQTETRPLGGSSSGDTTKREVNQADYEAIRPTKKSPNPVGSQWLNAWSQDMRQQQRHEQRTKAQQQTAKNPLAANAGNGHAEAAAMPIPTKPFIEESALRQLQQLYAAGRGQPVNLAAIMPADTMGQPKLRYDNSLIPPVTPTKRRQAAKITADLMDVDLS